jgi:putative acetyltransferase
MVKIRPELPEDIEAIYNLNKKAFEQIAEADLINKLRTSGALTLSLVAIKNNEVIGHIAFSPVTIESERATVNAIGLGPMAVLPEHQRKGIGSQLVEVGLNKIQQLGYEIVVVLGHPDYYSRFGFIPAKKYGIQWEHEAPEEAFMIKELHKGALKEISGTVKYRPEFNDI